MLKNKANSQEKQGCISVQCCALHDLLYLHQGVRRVLFISQGLETHASRSLACQNWATDFEDTVVVPCRCST